MTGRDRAQIKLVAARLKLAEMDVRDTFNNADALKGAVDVLRLARDIDPEIVVKAVQVRTRVPIARLDDDKE